MNHKHFETIKSTQGYLIENPDQLNLQEDILISCDHQSHGHGQYEREWDAFPQTLCISFTLLANEVKTLTSLEIGCLIHKYFKEKYKVDLQLKWPNDLLNKEGQKVGGILINSSNNYLFVGVGLNYFLNLSTKSNYKTQPGSIFKLEPLLDKKQQAMRIYEFILANRMLPDAIIKYWNNNCSHLNSEIIFIENNKESKGIFTGIGSQGEALINFNGNIESKFSGSIQLPELHS